MLLLPVFKAIGDKWVTIHPHGKGAVGKYGDKDYRRIKIDESGNVMGGSVPKDAIGKPIHEAFRKQSKPPSFLSQHLSDHNAKHEITETENGNYYKLGDGVQYGKDKWGRDTVVRGSVHFQKPVSVNGWDGNWVRLDSNFFDKDELKDMGARFNGDTKKWYIPLKDVPNVAKHFKHAEIDPSVSASYEKLLSQQPPQEKKQVEIKTAKGPVQFEAAEPPAWNGDMPDDMKHVNLYRHQKAGVEFLLKHKKAILGMAVGLGKTPSAITAANVSLDKGEVKRFAVIAPSSVKYQWKSEIEKFSGRKAVVLDTSSKKKLEQSIEQAKDADFVIGNYEMLRNPEYADMLKELAGAVIADEGHKIKNAGSQQTKAFNDAFKDAKYKWLLTATPFPNGQPKETHTMLHHVNPKKAGTWLEFAKNHAVMQKVHTASGDVLKPVSLKNQDKLRENMKDVVFLRHHGSPDVNSSLPSARHITHNVEMTKDQEKRYRIMLLGIRDELSGMSEEQFRRNAANILTKMKRLEQIALDPDQLDPANADTKKLYPKEQWAVETTIDHLENADNRGMVIFSDAKLPLEKVKNGLIKEGLQPSEIGIISGDVTPEKRKQVADLFGQGKIKVVLSTSAGEEGVNLQHGGHTMIHLDTPWVPKSITQREGRVLRTGQKSNHTVFYSPTMTGTIEDRKRGKLASKVAEIEKLLGEGSAGSASENIKAAAKTWTLKDMKELLGDTGDMGVKKSMRTKDEWKDVKKRKQSEYGKGEYFADAVHDSYPLTKNGKPNRERTLAAWRYISQRHNADEYSAREAAYMKSKIRRFAKEHFDMGLESQDKTNKSFILALPIKE